MKVSQIVFNVIALVIAGICLLSVLSAFFLILPATPVENRGFWHFLIALEIIWIILLGGGAIANFAKGKLASWPTGMIVAGYCTTLWLMPLAVWGIVALLNERKRRSQDSGLADSK